MTDPILPYGRSRNPSPVQVDDAVEVRVDPLTGGLWTRAVPGDEPIQEVTITIDRTTDGFPGLGAGVMTFLKSDASPLPTGAMYLGGYVDAAGWIAFTSGAVPTVTVRAQAFAAGDLWGNVNVDTTAGPFPAVGAPGALGFPTFPVGGGTLAVQITSSVDLNTLTQGHVVVHLFWTIASATSGGANPEGEQPWTTSSPYGRTIFGRRMVATPYTLGDYESVYGIDPSLFVPPTLVGGGTVVHLPLQAGIRLAVTGANGDRALLTTKRQHRYQAGRQQHWLTTLQHSDIGQVNQVRRWGYFDANDGLFFELNGTTLRLVRRSSVSGAPVDVTIAQTAWNVDKMQGVGPSGINLNLLNGSIYECMFQYLGVGGVAFFVDDWLAHFMDLSNSLPTPYMACPHLPMSWEIVNQGASVAGNIVMNCSNVTSDGGETPPNVPFGHGVQRNAVAGNTEAYAFSVRLAPTFATVQNRMELLPTLLSGSSETNRASMRLVFDATLVGATWAATPPAGSGVQIDVAAAYTPGTGQEIFFTFIPSSGGAGGAGRDVDLTPVFNKLGGLLKRWGTAAGACDALTVLIRNEQAGNSDLHAHLNWMEFR